MTTTTLPPGWGDLLAAALPLLIVAVVLIVAAVTGPRMARARQRRQRRRAAADLRAPTRIIYGPGYYAPTWQPPERIPRRIEDYDEWPPPVGAAPATAPDYTTHQRSGTAEARLGGHHLQTPSPGLTPCCPGPRPLGAGGGRISSPQDTTLRGRTP